MSSGFFGTGYASAKTGQLVELAFVPDPMWPGFDIADNRIAAKADAPRLARAIGQRWRLPDDTYDTETHFRYPDGTRLRRGEGIVSGGLSVLFGAPGIAGNVVTFAGMGVVSINATGQGGKRFYCIKYNADPVGSVYVVLGDSASMAPANAISLNIENDGTWTISTTVGGVNTNAPFVAPYPVTDDELILWRDGGTGEWGIVLPDGTNTGDMSGAYGGVWVGDGFAGFGADAAVMEFMPTGFSLPSPVGYSTFTAGGASNVGQRRGSTKSGGTAITIEQMPPHNHPASGQTEGQHGGGGALYIDAMMGEGTTTGDTGGGEAHDHDIDPEHVITCVLVKL